MHDYKSFIGGAGLLPDQHRWLAALLCGWSWRENAKYGVYFEPDHRNSKWTIAHYLGVYHEKHISHVGRLVAEAVCRNEDGELIVESEEFGSLDADHRSRIQGIIKEAETYFEGFSPYPYRYYVVDKFVETDVQKVSRGGMMGHRYLDIAQLGEVDDLQPGLSSEDVADMLRGTTYE